MRKTSGVSLMLLIFLSLCLIIFSLLSLSGAVADETLSSQAAERTTKYYTAVTSANDMLTQIDTQLAAYLREAESSDSSVDSEASHSDSEESHSDSEESSLATAASQQEAVYLQLCNQIGEDIPGVALEDDTLAFSVEIDDDQLLQVRLDIAYPSSDDDPLYHIHTWKVVNTDDWNADNSMHLFRSKNLS